MVDVQGGWSCFIRKCTGRAYDITAAELEQGSWLITAFCVERIYLRTQYLDFKNAVKIPHLEVSVYSYFETEMVFVYDHVHVQ